MTNWTAAYTIALAIFIPDQLTKWIVPVPSGARRLRGQIEILPIFNLTRVENNGISLGLPNATMPTGGGCWWR